MRQDGLKTKSETLTSDLSVLCAQFLPASHVVLARGVPFFEVSACILGLFRLVGLLENIPAKSPPHARMQQYWFAC